MRKISLALVLAVLCVSLGGCFPVSQLNERILIQAIAVDYEGGLFDVTLQYFVAPSGENNNTDVTGSALISGQGENLSEAFRSIAVRSSQTLFFGHNRLLVIGQNALDQKFSEIIHFFNTDHQTHPNISILTTFTKASDIISNKIGQNTIRAQEIEETIKNVAQTGDSFMSTLFYVVKSHMDPTQQTAILKVQPIENFDDVRIVVDGVTLLKDGRIVAQGDVDMIRGINWIRSDIQKAVVTVEDADIGLISCESIATSAKTHVTIENGAPIVWVDVNNTCRVLEMQNGDPDFIQTKMQQVEQEVSAAIQAEMEHAIDIALYQNDCDVFDFCNYIRSQQTDYFLSFEDPSQIVPLIQVRTSVNTRIERVHPRTEYR